jgi:hypothetical protein
VTRESAYITFNPAGGNSLRPILPETCREFAAQMALPFFGDNKANGFWSQVGFDPGYGYLLLRKADIDKIDFTSSNHSLTFTTGKSTVSISSLCAVHATAVFAVNADKANNLYLLYLEDLRRFGPWGSINRAFNVPTQRWTKSLPVDFYAGTLNGGVEWTWTQIVDEVWADVPSVLGALNKAAASFPSASPSNLAFHGISPWDALKRICELTGHIFVLTRSGEAKLIASSDADATNEALFTANVNRCLIPTREEWSTGVSLPATVRVFFQSHNLAFQNSSDPLTVTELDYYKSADDPDTPVTWRDVATNTITADPTVAGTIYPARSGLIARYDYDGSAENAAALTAEAASVAAKIINGLKRSAKPRHDLFHGPIAFEPGSTVHNIAWYDFGDGVRTEVTSNISPRKSGGGSAAPLLTPAHVSESAHAAVEALAPPDLYRHHDPYQLLIVGKAYEAIPANDHGICRVLYGIYDGTDVTLEETGLPHEVTGYETFGKSIAVDDQVLLLFHRQTSRWLVLKLGDTTGVPFRNDSGEEVPAYAVMKVVDQVAIGGVDHLTINKPDYTFQRRYLINTGTAVANTETGLGNWLDESALVLYDESEGDPNGEEWGAWPGQWTLKKERLGFTLFKKSANGVALGSQREVVSIFGKFYDKLEQGKSAIFRIWMRYDGKKRDTQMTVDAYDWYLNKDEEIAKNTQGEVAWYSNKWHVRNAYCSEDDTDDAAGGMMDSMGTDGSGMGIVSPGNNYGLPAPNFLSELDSILSGQG